MIENIKKLRITKNSGYIKVHCRKNNINMLYIFTFTEFNNVQYKLIDAVDIYDAIRTYVLDDTANQSLIFAIIEHRNFSRGLDQQDKILFSQLNSELDETFPEEQPSQYPDEVYTNFLTKNLENIIKVLEAISKFPSEVDAEFRIEQPTIIVSDFIGIKSARKK